MRLRAAKLEAARLATAPYEDLDSAPRDHAEKAGREESHHR
jgi:hypothetical protein